MYQDTIIAPIVGAILFAFYFDSFSTTPIRLWTHTQMCLCRNSLQMNTTPEPPNDLILKYTNLNSPFYTIDYAEKEDGSWIVVETGDGQVSGISEGQDYEAFFRALYHALT